MKTITHEIIMPSGARITISAQFEISIQDVPVVVQGDRNAFLEESGVHPFSLEEAFSGNYDRAFDHLREKGFIVRTTQSGEWEEVSL